MERSSPGYPKTGWDAAGASEMPFDVCGSDVATLERTRTFTSTKSVAGRHSTRTHRFDAMRRKATTSEEPQRNAKCAYLCATGCISLSFPEHLRKEYG